MEGENDSRARVRRKLVAFGAVGAAAGIAGCGGGVSTAGAGQATGSAAAGVPGSGYIDPKDASIGAVGDGVSDDTEALQSAIREAASTKRPIYLPQGVYLVSRTLRIESDGVQIIGLGGALPGRTRPSFGATIRYTGGGNAILVGKGLSDAGVGGGSEFISRVVLANLRIEVSDGAACALVVYLASEAIFDGLSLFGNRGSGRALLRSYGGIANRFANCDFDGGGSTDVGNVAGFVEFGADFMLGPQNAIITTTTVENCYFHYCQTAVRTAGRVTFDLATIFESIGIGLMLAPTGVTKVRSCWFENNQNADIQFMQDTRLLMSDTEFVTNERRLLFTGVGFKQIVMRDCVVYGTHPAPVMFDVSCGLDAADPLAYGVISGCSFPANLTLGGYQRALSFDRLRFADMMVVPYRFLATSAGGSGTFVLLTENGAPSYTMPVRGDVVGVSVQLNGNAVGGTWSLIVNHDSGGSAVAVADLTIDFTGARSVRQLAKHWQASGQIAAGAGLSVLLALNGLTPAQSISVEVLVAHGPDGRGLTR